MEFKLAKPELNSKAKSISLDEIIKTAEENGSATFYLDSENNAKDIQKLRTSLEKANKSVQLNELKYGLDSHLYELHIISYQIRVNRVNLVVFCGFFGANLMNLSGESIAFCG